MMKRSMILAVLAASATATPAFSQSVDGTVDITGSVADRCLFTTPSATLPLGELARSGTDTNAGRLDESKVDGESRTLVGWCNGTAATMSVEAFALTNSDFTSPAPNGFDRVINFTATADANSESATDTSVTAGAGSAVNVGLFTGNVVVTLSESATPGGGLLVAGDYDGQVVVTLTPNVSFNQPAA
ncbi:MAG TPA: hypothetical protein VFO69_07365 [Allosphingosinicella sp.]|nr:hypothetical protein [Allosphingosinicella sp.]